MKSDIQMIPSSKDISVIAPINIKICLIFSSSIRFPEVTSPDVIVIPCKVDPPLFKTVNIVSCNQTHHYVSWPEMARDGTVLAICAMHCA
jgi:hypothetical protein